MVNPWTTQRSSYEPSKGQGGATGGRQPFSRIMLACSPGPFGPAVLACAAQLAALLLSGPVSTSGPCGGDCIASAITVKLF
jgi:hypothetical protein